MSNSFFLICYRYINQTNMKQIFLFNARIGCLLISIGFHSFTFSQKNNDSPAPTLTTYLFFNGNCKEAMEFYSSCFGGKLTQTPVGQSPMKSFFPDSLQNRIVNARLVNETVDISASDWLRPAQTPIQGNMVCLYLSGGKPGHLKDLFDKLSTGANVTDPLKQQSFGLYGALTDKFGVRWMFHTDQKE